MTALGDSARCDLCQAVGLPDELDAAVPPWKRFVGPDEGVYVDCCSACMARPILDLVAASWDAELRGITGEAS